MSLSSIANYSEYTYVSGDVHSTVEYVLADADAVSRMSRCFIAEMEDLNIPDNVPIFVKMMYDPLSHVHTSEQVMPRINLALAERNGFLSNYCSILHQCLYLVPDNSYQCIKKMNFAHVSEVEPFPLCTPLGHKGLETTPCLSCAHGAGQSTVDG